MCFSRTVDGCAVESASCFSFAIQSVISAICTRGSATTISSICVSFRINGGPSRIASPSKPSATPEQG